MLEPMPITLGDFLYGYAEGCSINSDADRRMLWAMQCIRDLRGTNHLPADSGDLAQRLHRALQKRIDRQERQKHWPLPLFPDWAQDYSSYARAWHHHQNGEQLLQIFADLDIGRSLVVRAACDCARTALRYVPKGEDRPRIAIETAEAWCEGRASIGQVSAAGSAAADDARGANAAHAGAAAAAAAHAAHADVAAYAAANAAYYAAAAEAAEAAARKQHADLVRSRIPWSVVRDEIRTKEHRRLP